MNTQGIPRQPAGKHSSTFFIAVCLFAALILLLQLGAETKYSANGKLFAQPRFWPAVGVVGMVFFGITHLALAFYNRVKPTIHPGGAFSELLTWAKAVEYLVWFLLYVHLVPVIGYLPATIIFTVLLAARQGYRSKNQLLTAAATGIVIVLVFKTGLSVKIPGGAIYEYLPQTLRNIAIIYF